MKIEPSPTEEEAAAIVAALETLTEEEQQDTASLKRSRWRLVGILGHPVKPGIEPDVSLWSYSKWEG